MESVIPDGQFRQLVDQNPKAMMLTTPEPRIVFVNQAFSRITGYRPDQVIGEKPSVLSSGLHDKDFYATIWHELEHNKRWEGLIWNRRQQGDLYPQWLTIYPVSLGNRRFYAGILLDVGDPDQLQDKQASYAYYDMLTGLPNRYLFKAFLDSRLAQNRSSGNRFAVLYLDLDRFKDINDLYGHATGDAVLWQAASRFKAFCRGDDVLGRLSGDEFAAIVGIAHEHDLETRCQSLIEAARRPITALAHTVPLDLSIGISIYPDDGRNANELLQKADQAMYHAKTQGRGRFYLFDTDMQKKTLKNQQIAAELQIAVTSHPEEFFAVYQPYFDLKSGQRAGAEVLLRWQSPELGLVPPSIFIPIAEIRGHIDALSKILIQRVIHDLHNDKGPGIVGHRISINISAQQVSTGSALEFINPLLEFLQQRQCLLVIEITESQLIDLHGEDVQKLKQLRTLGVQIAIDDFGTGYSSLAYLSQLPFDLLKIDRTFVSATNRDQQTDQAIIKAIMTLSKALGVDIIAEGIETESQRATLFSIGVTYGQGFGLAMPAPWQLSARRN